jgi:hypothetical protein
MLDFIEDFQPLDKKFDESVLMTPHFKFWRCKDCSGFMETQCFGKGKYCGHDIRNNKLNGRDVILEELRQMCIYKSSYGDNARNIWWDYIKEYHSLCYGAISEDCSRGAHTMLKLNYDLTQQCV